MPGKGSRRRIAAPRRAHVILIGVLSALAAGIMLFDWNWLRGPLVNYLAKKSGREIRVDDLQVVRAKAAACLGIDDNCIGKFGYLHFAGAPRKFNVRLNIMLREVPFR